MAHPLCITWRKSCIVSVDRRLRNWFCAAALASVFAAPPVDAGCADLALVLAIDASGSMSIEEFEAQRDGFARALNRPEVLAAIRDAGRVEMAVVFWADADFPVMIIPWHEVSEDTQRARLVATMMGFARSETGTTGLANGLRVAVDMLAARKDCDWRRVVNVSGDGRDTRRPRPRNGSLLSVERYRAEQLGITVNGLAIINGEADLGDYYRENLIVGPDAFVVAAENPADLSAVITGKLVREIRPMQTAQVRFP